MSALQDEQHERFAREFVRVRSAREAYRRATPGVEPTLETARNMRNLPDIRRRIEELQSEGESMTVDKAELVELHMDIYDLAVRGQEDYGFNVKKGCYELTGRINRELATAEKALAGIERLLEAGEGGAQGESGEPVVKVYFDARDGEDDSVSA